MNGNNKICKPTHSQTRGFDSCGKAKYIHKYGLCSSCFYDWMQKDERGKIYYQKQFKTKVKKVVEKKQKEKTKKQKDDLTNWRKKLQTNIQLITRLIDKGLPCLARGIYANQVHSGHVFAKGGHSTMALNLHNMHRQSAQSNTFFNDDGKLRDGLVSEYGESYLDFIRNINLHKPLKFSNKEYQEKYYTSLEVSNMLKKKDLEYSLQDRIRLRNEINVLLGIYKEDFCVFNL